ncbi:NfeD family protein [Candidatus Methylacidithermus pantelleriae]|uniref:NfeD family protein n=1 Tax=Candidatus Methylacidithermus pantelleriae TaxID=2744239 RepID=UPI00157C20EA|nr:NfeD family protein [Candidatus Methylacidithermus pantelleriae]
MKACFTRVLVSGARTWVTHAMGLALLFWANVSEAGSPVFVLPIHGEIEPAMVYWVRRGVRQAIQAKARALVLDLDTPGGRADAMEAILSALKGFPHPDATYSFIRSQALSAGAFLAAATRHIYMAPGSVIGAATPVLVAPGTWAPQALPESYEKKITSAFEALIRATAEANGHDPRVFAAMVDRELGLVIDGVEVLPKGKLLTLTNREAERKVGNPPRSLLSEGTVATLEGLVEQIAGPGTPVVWVRPTGFERLARGISLAGPLLLTLGLLLGYLELKLPGAWIFGLGSLLCFLLFFFGHYLAGLSGWEPLALFLLGLLFLLLELWMVPGLILPSVVGILLAGFALLLAAAGDWPGRTRSETIRSWTLALGELLGSIAVSLIFLWVFSRWLPHRVWSQDLDQGTVSGSGSSTDAHPTVEVGETGVAWTVLRPSGQARFENRLVDVVTDGVFIAKGTPVRVARREGSKVVVEPLVPESGGAPEMQGE